MATNTSLCAICNLRHLTTSSTHWCPECEEALCVECKEHHIISKASRGHNVIPISEYNSLPPFIASINIFCTYHNEKYTQYCVKHEVPICYKCIKEHGHCDELTIIEDVALGMKSSKVFREMEQSVNDIMVNINRIRSDRESNLKILKVKKTQIFEVVSRFKETITRYLDRLQEDFMTELDKVEAECCDKIESIVSSLNAQYEEMIQCNAEIENIKKYVSDIQSFLGVKKIQKNITQNEQLIQSMVQNKLVEKVSLDFTFDT
ncbi:E3 ubiquitin/ISG15 ligase TRIM25-like [Mytilus trossulus]|uniref:E3 ubiquitin/ISG15 ligase TRIM25-like n=1 Tax=Mytilus trossulus TaxID=6551 RepID=UPI0030044098